MTVSNEKFYVDPSGVWLGSFDGAIPGSAVEVPFPPVDARQIWDFQAQTYSDAPAQPYQIAKTTPWLRMTEAEAAIMDVVMSEADAQQKQIYMAALYLSSGDPLWQTLHQLLADNLPGGSDRADELLAPET